LEDIVKQIELILDWREGEGDVIDLEILEAPVIEVLREPSPPSQPSTPSVSVEDQLDRIEWSTQMIHVLFTELLEQAQDGKRADSGFKKEAWDSVLKEVRLVYSGSYPIPLQKINQKEQAYKALYTQAANAMKRTALPTLTNRALDQLVKGCQMAMNSAALLAEEKGNYAMKMRGRKIRGQRKGLL
jgi:hypothetical protein